MSRLNLRSRETRDVRAVLAGYRGGRRRRGRERPAGAARTRPPARSSTWTTPSWPGRRSTTSPAGWPRATSSPPGDILDFAWQQVKFRVGGKESTEGMISAREAALAFVAGKRVDEIVRLGEEIYDELMAERIWTGTQALAQLHLDAGPAGLAGDRDPGRAGLDHRPPARADRRARHGRRGRRRASTPAGWSASRCTGRPRRRRCSRWPTGRGSTSTGARRTATRSTTCRCCPPSAGRWP